jgi:hypothetical protein
MTSRTRSCVVLALSVAAMSRTVRAAEPTKVELAAARDLFSRAERDEEAGRWADALDKLRRTGAVKMTPGIRFHIALCEERMGQLAAALADYTAAADAARNQGNKDVLDAVSEPLAQIRGRVPTVTLLAPVDVSDATITLDGAPIPGRAVGGPLPVEIGPHTIQAEAPNRVPFSATLNLAEAQTLSVDILLPLSSPLAVGTPAPASAITAEQRPRPARAMALIASTGAVALAGLGVGAFFVAGSQQSTAEKECIEMVSCESLRGPVRTWDALALAGWVAGAGVGAVAIYLWTRPSSPSDERPTAAIRLGPGSMQIVGTF